jgi:hypothetical protein
MLASFTKSLLVFSLFAACTVVAVAQQPPEFPGPEKEHGFLKQFVGEWETASEAVVGPGQPPMKCQGKMKARMLGDLWVLVESEGSMAEMKFSALMTLGYDPQKKKYIGTWVDSMMNYLWHYDGTVDGKALTLSAEGPNFMAGGKQTKFQDIYEFKTADEVAITSKMLGDDGKWVTFMTGTGKRK